jgi:uncharacterized membrane protein YgaE (UPF0421/DUF939 family)
MEKWPKKLQELAENRAKAIWSNLLTNHLWQRMFKNTLATTITIILAMIPAVVTVYGKATYLAPITTVFGHPGRRFGMMAEALVLAISGTLVGIGWSTFGIYLSSLIYESNPPAAYTIRGLFLVVALLMHGFLRSHTPRLFIFVLLLIIVSVVSLTSTATLVSKTSVTLLLYPILTASGVLLLVNTLVFPEFSSSFLGITTIETLGETVGALRGAGKYFVTTAINLEKSSEEMKAEEESEDQNEPATAAEEPKEKTKSGTTPSLLESIFNIVKKSNDRDSKITEDSSPETVKLKSLTDKKAKLRAKLASCKAAQQECNFELAWAVLPPRDLKPISDTYMKKLVANTIALIGACESKYALMGDENDKKEDESQLKGVAEGADVEIDKETSRPGTGVDNSHDCSMDEKKDEMKGKTKESCGKKTRNKSKTRLEREVEDLELVKPRKEIEFGDAELLRYLITRISKPLINMQEKIDRSVDVVTSCLAYCYDVPKLPSSARAPKGIQLEEIDIRIDILTEALVEFDRDSAAALEGAAALHSLDHHSQVDIMPRMETFLISSFLLNLRQVALHILEMLRHSREIVEKRQARYGRRRLYAPRINWKKWLVSGGEEDMLALPENARKDARTGTMREDAQDDSPSTSNESLLKKKDIESVPQKDSPSPPPTLQAKQAAAKNAEKQEKGSLTHWLRNSLADYIEYLVGSEDVLYAFKLTIAVFLVTWPAFLHQWNAWYSLNRGLWAALQLVLITEVAIGTSVMTFTLRAVGTTLGCVWGYAAYQAGNGNRVICVVVLVIGIIPSTYIQLGSKYVKAGIVSIVSMSIVALAIVDKTVSDTPTETFLKRLIAFLVGGVVALIVQVVLFPVRARDRLVESLAASIHQIIEMEACLAYGIETEANIDVHAPAVSQRFERAKAKAGGALSAAETFLPFCANEPRLKGSFKGLALVYAEILYVLHAVVDRMDNMLYLRQEYGSGVLEELNPQVYPYRRNVAGSITLILFAVHEALTTKLPLPQFLPSARLAHLRMVNRVREVVLKQAPGMAQKYHEPSEIEMAMVKRIVRQKFLSWNAAAAGQIEVIEYLEELIDLTKLLVGANEFRSGILTRPTYREYMNQVGRGAEPNAEIEKETGAEGRQDEMRDVVPEKMKLGLTRRRITFSKMEEGLKKKIRMPSKTEAVENERQAGVDELPRSLQRVRSRRVEEMNLQKTRTVDEEARRREGKRIDKAQ